MRGRLLAGAAVLVLAACGAEGAPAVASEVPMAAACDNDGQRIALVGYLRLPDSFKTDALVLHMYETDDFTGVPVGVSTRIGSDPNEINDVPTSFTDEDLVVHLGDGTSAGFGTPVKVSGKVYKPLVDQDFECALTEILVEAAGT